MAEEVPPSDEQVPGGDRSVTEGAAGGHDVRRVRRRGPQPGRDRPRGDAGARYEHQTARPPDRGARRPGLRGHRAQRPQEPGLALPATTRSGPLCLALDLDYNAVLAELRRPAHQSRQVPWTTSTTSPTTSGAPWSNWRSSSASPTRAVSAPPGARTQARPRRA